MNSERNMTNIEVNITEQTWTKTFGIAASLINVAIFSPLFYSIIWYERVVIKRTLINQLVSSGCWVIIAYNFLVQTPEIYLSLNGPSTENFCRFHLFVKYVLAHNYTALLMAISLIKYLYIFVVKSPASLNDDFWIFFINLTISAVACFSQFVYQFLPGRNAFFYYMCIGTFPSDKESIKFNYFLSFNLILTIIIYIIVMIKMKIYACKDPIITVSVITREREKHPPPICNPILNDIADLTTLAFGLSLMPPFFGMLNTLNYADPKDLGTSPYNHLVIIYQHIQPALVHGFILGFYFKGQPNMRKYIWNKMKRSFTFSMM